jgi:type IV secretory pathway VirD2 relaxase
LRPRAPKRDSDDGRVWPEALRRILQLVQVTRRGAGFGTLSSRQKASFKTRRFSQRCAVRVTYCRNKTAGQWAAHGRYLVRESAISSPDGKARGFSATEADVDLVRTLGKWQQAGDERMFKLILSPEFGERMDLHRLTRDLLSRMEADLGNPLEWVAVAHFNTEHPHVHVALRGVAGGQPLRLPPDYIKRGIRVHAEDLSTAQLGYRTGLDIAESQRREVAQQRFTSLDMAIQRHGSLTARDADGAQDIQVALDGLPAHVQPRLAALRSMGLAEPATSGTWRVRADFEHVLRSMQKAVDRQKMLARNAALLSDERLPQQVTPVSNMQHLAGRVLAHVLDDTTGTVHMLLEGTDARVHFIAHNGDIEAARQRGELKPNRFVEIRRPAASSQTGLVIRDFGDAEDYLTSTHLKNTARNLLRRGAVADAPAWGGWLGRYYDAVGREAEALGLGGERRDGHAPARHR